jgi:hypothetical protein
MMSDAAKQHILTTLQDWAGARGCGTMRDRMNAALDALEAEAPLQPELFDYAYREAKKIIERGARSD